MRGRARRPAPGYALGAALALLAGAAFSTGGVLIREMAEADGWQILFYRSLMVLVGITVFVAVRYRGRVGAAFRGIGRPGLIYALALALAFASFIQAVTLTAVANVSVIISTEPFFAAAVAWLVLRERVSRAVWTAIVAALIGIAVMLGDALEGGGLRGNLVALGVPAATAVVVVVVRARPARDMMPAIALGGAMGMAIAAAGSAGSLAAPWGDIGLALRMGVTQIALGFTLLTLAARWVPAADVGLFVLSEIPLAPLWVWATVNEVPPTLTFLGGGIVVGAAIAAMLWGRRTALGAPGEGAAMISGEVRGAPAAAGGTAPADARGEGND